VDKGAVSLIREFEQRCIEMIHGTELVCDTFIGYFTIYKRHRYSLYSCFKDIGLIQAEMGGL
jgi:hypothetical protein